MYHVFHHIVATLGLLQLAAAQFKCDVRMYGRPKLEDCASTHLALPNPRSRGPEFGYSNLRHFVEPQLLEPPFSPVENDLVEEMEQLPKFWRYSKSMGIFEQLAR